MLILVSCLLPGLLENIPALKRLDLQEDLAELARPAGLLFVAVVTFGVCHNRLAVGNLRRFGIDLKVESLFHLGEHYPQVQVTDARYDRLVGLGIA